MNRRDFLLVTAMASAAIASGNLPLLAQTKERTKEKNLVKPKARRQTRNIFTQPPAIEPITGYLPAFSMVEDGDLNSGSYELTYKAILWSGVDSEINKSKNREGGSLVLRRQRQAGDRAIYTVDQKRQHGRRINHLNAEIICSDSDDYLMEWRMTSSFSEARTGDKVSELDFSEEGKIQGNAISLSNGHTDDEFQTKKLVFSQWNMVGLLAKGVFHSMPIEFDMMHELSVFKPDQMLKYSGEVQISVATDDASLHCYVQTGYGVLPTHYLVDCMGRVQLITQSMLSWALQEVR